MYASYRNYDAALGAASAVPGSPTMVNVPLADVREQLSRLGLDPAAVATSLNAAFKMPGLQELSPTFSVGDASVQMPAVVWARLMGTVSPILPATMVDAPWTVQYRWPLILGLGAIGLLAAYKLLWKPSRQVRMARNKRSVRRNKGQELILDGYVFEYEGSGSGSLDELVAAMKAPDDDWEVVMVSDMRAHPVHMKRKIDGSLVSLYQGADGHLYAAQPGHSKWVRRNPGSARCRCGDANPRHVQEAWKAARQAMREAMRSGDPSDWDLAEAEQVIAEEEEERCTRKWASGLASNPRRKSLKRNARRIPRIGTRVRFDPDPVSLAMYNHAPRVGEEGTVSTVAGIKGQYLPGPGGGLLYVDWDESAFQGVSLWDVVALPRSRQKNWGGRFKKGGGR